MVNVTLVNGRSLLGGLEIELLALEKYFKGQFRIIPRNDMPILISVPKTIRYCQQCQHLRLCEDVVGDVCRYCLDEVANSA